MQCKKCYNDIEESSKYCKYCGANQEENYFEDINIEKYKNFIKKKLIHYISLGIVKSNSTFNFFLIITLIGFFIPPFGLLLVIIITHFYYLNKNLINQKIYYYKKQIEDKEND